MAQEAFGLGQQVVCLAGMEGLASAITSFVASKVTRNPVIGGVIGLWPVLLDGALVYGDIQRKDWTGAVVHAFPALFSIAGTLLGSINSIPRDAQPQSKSIIPSPAEIAGANPVDRILAGMRFVDSGAKSARRGGTSEIEDAWNNDIGPITTGTDKDDNNK